MKLVIWSYLAEGEIVAERLSAFFDVLVVKHKADLAAALQDAAGLLLENSRYDEDIAALLRGCGVGWIQLLSAGYENLVRHGIPPGTIVTNAGDSRSPGVAEHAVTLLLALARRLPAILEAAGEEAWRPGIAQGISTLEDREALIVGYGSLGRQIATRLLAFGMRVKAVNRSPVDDRRLSGSSDLGGLDEALSTADVVAIAIACVPATRHLFSAPQLAAMRPNALLVNVARGGVIDTEALISSLEEGRIAGAALDVTDPEPLPPGHALWRAPNLIVSPHLGGTSTHPATARLCDAILAAARRVLSGQEPEGIILRGK